MARLLTKVCIYPLVLLLLASCKVNCQWPESFVVAKDGSGDFQTIQEAVNAFRDLSQTQVQIFIKAGVYNEKLVIPSWKTHISLIGENRDTTIITNDDYSGKPYPGIDSTGRDTYNTFTSYTMLVQGNHITLANLTIQNTAGEVGQAVALHVDGDKCLVRNCNLLGHQDTLYLATRGSRQVYIDCHIKVTTDFIFGEATAIFRNCVIMSLRNSYITAASTRPGQFFGFVFKNCTLEATPDVSRVYLGRPWRPYARTVFMSTRMGPYILPEGWDNWGEPENEKTAFYAEYLSEGVDVSQRVAWSLQLTGNEAELFTDENILNLGHDHWLPEI